MPSEDAVPSWWTYGPEARPARSLIAGIDPIGVGTPLCEDLASYFSRQAWGEGRSPVRLVNDVLAPALANADGAGPDDAAWRSEFERVTRHPAASVTGHAPAAATWADALEAATGRTGLRALTLLAWADVLPRKGLMRDVRAWCPACLEAWRRNGVVYAPLIWQVAEVAMCPEHEVRLSTRCPECGRSAGVLTAWGRVGYCPCGAWLAGKAFAKLERVSGDELNWQRYVTTQVGALIAATPRLPEPPAGAETAEAVRVCWQRTGMSLTRLAQALGMALATVSLWKDGRRQPSLPGALRLCRVASVDLVPFLRGDLDALKSSAPPTSIPYVRPSDETHREIDWQNVEAALRAALLAPEAISLARLLRQAGVDNRQAKRELPELCAEIAARHRRWTQRRVRAARARDAQLVRDVILALRLAGVYPSRHQVQKRLPRAVSLRRPDLHQIWIDEARDPQRRFLKT